MIISTIQLQFQCTHRTTEEHNIAWHQVGLAGSTAFVAKSRYGCMPCCKPYQLQEGLSPASGSKQGGSGGSSGGSNGTSKQARPPHLLRLGNSRRVICASRQERLLLRCGRKQSGAQAQHDPPAGPRCCFGGGSRSIDMMCRNVRPGPCRRPGAAAHAVVACSALRSGLHGNLLQFDV